MALLWRSLEFELSFLLNFAFQICKMWITKYHHYDRLRTLGEHTCILPTTARLAFQNYKLDYLPVQRGDNLNFYRRLRRATPLGPCQSWPLLIFQNVLLFLFISVKTPKAFPSQDLCTCSVFCWNIEAVLSHSSDISLNITQRSLYFQTAPLPTNESLVT